jgi:hypothetical protein
LTALFSRVGLSGVTGSKLSGKSCRLLQCAHDYHKSNAGKDIVWLDFDGISSELEGVTRIGQTLYFRRCMSFAQLEPALTSFLNGLREGSVVVFDNVHLQQDHMRLHGVGTGKLVLKHFCPNNYHHHSVLAFFRQLLHLCHNNHKNLAFIVATDAPDSLSDSHSGIKFEEIVNIGPLGDAVADELITALQHSTVCGFVIVIGVLNCYNTVVGMCSTAS